MTPKLTTGDRRMAGGEGAVSAPQGSAERQPDSRPGGHEAGHDRCPPGSNLPVALERWRHLRSGIVATVVYVREDYLYVDVSGAAWPLDLFLARWEKT